MTNPTLQSIWRFPVKGFAGEQLTETKLVAGAGIAHDRQFAVTDGVKDTGEWMRANSFFRTAKSDGLQTIAMKFEGGEIILGHHDGNEIRFAINDEDSLRKANQTIAEFMKPIGVHDDLPPPQIIKRSASRGTWDYVDSPISIINTETVKQVGEALNADLDPIRFRGNLIVSDLAAWQEFSLMGKRIRIGGAVLDVHRPIDRCPAPGVNPISGERDVEVTPGLRDHFGHIYCGVYANVVEDGDIKPRDKLEVIGDSAIPLEELMVSNASAYPLWPRVAKITAYEVNEQITRLSLTNATPWPLPAPEVGQRVRFHLGPDQWTTEYISAILPAHYHFEVEKSTTGDPLTEQLRNGLHRSQEIIISGPFGKAANAG